MPTEMTPVHANQIAAVRNLITERVNESQPTCTLQRQVPNTPVSLDPNRLAQSCLAQSSLLNKQWEHNLQITGRE